MNNRPPIDKERSDEEILHLIWTANPNRKALKELYERIDTNNFSVSLDVVFTFLRSIVTTGGGYKWEIKMYTKIVEWIGPKVLDLGDDEIAYAIIKHSSLHDGIYIFEDLLSFLPDERTEKIITILRNNTALERSWYWKGIMLEIKERKAFRKSRQEL